MTLLAPTFLFRFAVPCHPIDKIWDSKQLELPDVYRLPNFGELENHPVFADLRMGWSPDGIAISIRVVGKKQSTWCRATRLEDSDGLALFIDTRDTQNIHRASRFCHQFVILPEGSGKNQMKPLADLVPIQRARENPKPIDATKIKARSEKRMDGYIMRAAIPAALLTGFDPEQQRRIGFSYAVMDREHGWQSFTIGAEFPFTSDPSLWGSLELVPA